MDGNWLPAELNVRKVRRFAPACRGDLLDIGCGSKPYEPILGERVSSYVGLEHPDTIHDRDKVDVWGDAADLPFEDATFDTVVSFHVLEHTESPDAVMAEVSRVLRPGGHVLLGLPFMWGIHEAPRDFVRLTPYGIERLFRTAGLATLAVEAACGTLAMLGMRGSYFLLRVAGEVPRPAATTAAAPLVAAVQLAGAVADRLYRDETDAPGYFALARKPDGA